MNITANIQLQRQFEVKYFKLIKAELQKEVDHVKGIVSRQGIHAAISYVNLHVHSKGVRNIIENLYLEVGLRFARRQYSELLKQQRAGKKSYIIEQKGFGFNAQWVKYIKDYLYKYLLDKITFSIAETTRNQLLTVLNNAIAGGWGLDKTVQQLSDLPLSKTQAARIVRTEATRAANTGAMAGGDVIDYEQTKEWIAAEDMRTRGVNPKDHASHVALNGTKIDYDEYFIDPRNGDRLFHPGDPNASAASTINCRCNVSVVLKVDARGRLIPKSRISVVRPGDFIRHNPIITI